MLEAVLEYLNNWFERNPVTRERRIHSGRLSVEGGRLVGMPEGFAAEGQYVRIRGSRLNDGVRPWPCGGQLEDEPEFTGSVWALSVPKAVTDLAAEVAEWCAKYGDVQDSPYVSESFGGYSYTKAAASGSQAGAGGSTWQSVFAARLAPWRKL